MVRLRRISSRKHESWKARNLCRFFRAFVINLSCLVPIYPDQGLLFQSELQTPGLPAVTDNNILLADLVDLITIR